MGTTTHLSIVILACASTVQAQGQEPLADLGTVQVAVEFQLNSNVSNFGLSEESLKTAVELRLRQSRGYAYGKLGGDQRVASWPAGRTRRGLRGASRPRYHDSPRRLGRPSGNRLWQNLPASRRPRRAPRSRFGGSPAFSSVLIRGQSYPYGAVLIAYRSIPGSARELVGREPPTQGC